MRDRNLTPVALDRCYECSAYAEGLFTLLIDCTPPPIDSLLEEQLEGKCVRSVRADGTVRWWWCATGVLDVPGRYRVQVLRR